MGIQTILESLDEQIFTPDLKENLKSVFESTINQKVQERLDLELSSMDESHANKMKSVLESMETAFEQYKKDVDEDHSSKLKTVLEHLKNKHNNELKIVAESYEKVLKDTAVTHRDELVLAVESYIEEYLGEAIPVKQIEEAAKNTFALKQLDEARKVLGIDKTMISENLKQGILEGKKEMDRLSKENADRKRALAISESKRVLTEKTANLPVEMAKYVRQRFAGKTANFIQENFSYVVDMYNKNETINRSTLIKEHNNIPQVDRAKYIADEKQKASKPVISESNDIMDQYVRLLSTSM